eukprot:TRINITY_DN1427_c0_g4_i4.p3 TRINITY_DN1427_c0_g4~~TRINITY_DN1427_c0_g4_i4.p3  ORF type:complete len:144 (-),score=39.85 TRINITY_DN1427_c0_g4_i4:688-1119(-)
MQELERVRHIKKSKRRIGDSSNLLKNLLLYAAKSGEEKGAILSKETLKFDDFNYQSFNPVILQDANKLSKEEGSEDEYEKGEYDEEDFVEELRVSPMPKEEIDMIRNAQRRDELSEIQQLKAAVNSQGIQGLQVDLFLNIVAL